MTQHESFVELFRKLVESFGVKKKHVSAKRSPIADSDNTIRLKGRLKKASFSDNLKHPVLHSAKHRVVVLMLRQMLEDNHHEGTGYKRSVVQHRIWVLVQRNPLLSIKANYIRRRQLVVQSIYPDRANLTN